MKKIIPILVLLIFASCAPKQPENKMYIVTVLKREYNPITGDMDPTADVDTVYEANDLDAYFDGANSFHAAKETVRRLGKKAAALMQPVSFSVVNAGGMDLSVILTEKQMDSIKRTLERD